MNSIEQVCPFCLALHFYCTPGLDQLKVAGRQKVEFSDAHRGPGVYFTNHFLRQQLRKDHLIR